MPATVGCVQVEWGRMRFFGLCSAIWLALAFVWISDAPWYSSSLGVSFPLAGGWFPRDMGIAGADSLSELTIRRVWRKEPCHLTTAGQCLHLSSVAVFLTRACRGITVAPGTCGVPGDVHVSCSLPSSLTQCPLVLQRPGYMADGAFRLPDTFRKYINCYCGNCILNRIFLYNLNLK